MDRDVFRVRRVECLDRCEHCGDLVARVWLVPGDVLDSCRGCFLLATGRPPVHEQGHTTVRRLPPPARAAASFYLRTDGRRPA